MLICDLLLHRVQRLVILYHTEVCLLISTVLSFNFRMFLLGRTETVHPGSAYSVAWVKAMEDPSVSKHTKQELFRKAVKHQNRFRLDATGGYGCDRHLLGLLCASRELGMDLPRLFMDKV